MAEIEVVVLDMDGVIIDSETKWKEQEGHFLKKKLPSWTDADYENITGLGIRQFYEYLVKRHCLDLDFEEFQRENSKIAKNLYSNEVSLYPGVRQFLDSARNLGLRTALASSSPLEWINIVLERFELGEYFEEVVSADHVGGRGKPAPDIYLYAAKQLNIEPGKCLVVEDSGHGVQAARDAGMKVLGYKNGFNQNQNLSRAYGLLFGFVSQDLGRICSEIEESELHKPYQDCIFSPGGSYQGKGLNHEDEHFQASLEILNGPSGSRILEYRATDLNQEVVFHEEKSLLAMDPCGTIRLCSVQNNVAGILEHRLVCVLSSPSGLKFDFVHGDLYSSDNFRERIRFEFHDDERFLHAYDWGMPGGTFEKRSGLILGKNEL